MDVRCEKCRTEYELDESKLKPGGVTVKCTACGHMFKVRRAVRSTSRGIPASTPAPPPADPAPRPRVTSPADGEERTWLIQLEDGEIKTCQELATLQKWIVGGRVTRDCKISRTGKKWKTLGEIAELASFFDIADEARDVAVRSPAPRPPSLRAEGSAPRNDRSAGEKPATHPRTIRRKSSIESARRTPSGAILPADPELDAPWPDPMKAEPARLRSLSPAPTPDEPTHPSAMMSLVAGAGRLAEPDPADDSDDDAVPRHAAAQKTGGWATQPEPPALPPRSPASATGPIGGKLRQVDSDEAAFAGRAKRISIKGEFENGAFVPTDDDFDPIVPESNLGRWIVIGSLAVIAIAGIAVYFLVFRGSSGDPDEEPTSAAQLDAGAVAAAASDAAPTARDAAPVLAPAASKELVDQAAVALAADATAGLEQLETKLAAVTAPDPALAVARARVEVALGQHAADAAAVATTPAQQNQLLASSRERAGSALILANNVLATDPASVGAMVAKADALRLQGRAAREIEGWLGKALQAAPQDRDALLSRALLYIRDNRLREARQVLTSLAGPDARDVRPRYRLALVDYAEKAYDAAGAGADVVLSAQPEHAGAKALREQIKAASQVVTSDPMPPEVGGDGAGKSSGSSGGGVDSYDRLLDKADKASESGNCGEAIALYNKALDIQPSGVAALTGLGYCHLDRKEFASAQAKFRAALGISSRYQDALWGVAEAYQQQGLKDQAITAYKNFIAKHPNSGRAVAARRQIEALGGSAEGKSGGEEPAPTPEGGSEPAPGSGDTGGDPGTGGETPQ